tara:strand:+ start:398 stop:598 length:201 start_codon:yes stop_codon:yes gene_type:complete
MIEYNIPMKESSYYQQAMELPKFQTYLLVSLIMASKEDALESIALRFMETQPEQDEYIPAEIEYSA